MKPQRLHECRQSNQRCVQCQPIDCSICDRVQNSPLISFIQVVRLLADCHEIFKERPIFFLLDEMENLTSAQWEVVNCLLKERDDPITFKVAASSEGRPTRDANGQTLRVRARFHACHH